MRGFEFEGSTANGDEVEVHATPRGTRVLRVDALQNRTANATVRATKKPRSALVSVPLFFTLVIALGAAAISAWKFPRPPQRENGLHVSFENGSDGTRTRDLRRDRPAF